MLRGLFWQIMITLSVGGALSTGLPLAIGRLLGADRVVLMSLAPTSVTMPIAMPLVLRTPCKRARSAVLLLRWP